MRIFFLTHRLEHSSFSGDLRLNIPMTMHRLERKLLQLNMGKLCQIHCAVSRSVSCNDNDDDNDI